jgi:UDP-N-acetylglucosamine acyltransferase
LIHPSAIIDSNTRIPADAEIGPYSVVGAQVALGKGCRIGPHVVLRGPTVIGDNNHIYQFASIGEDPQDKKYRGEPTRLTIGNGNTIREGCTISRGTVQDQGLTSIGDDNWIMANVHIAHDCVVGSHTIFANNATIAGHVHVGDWAILGGFTGVHQYCRIGAHALTSVFAYVSKDLPAYVIAAGRPAEPRGVNAEGLKRRGFTPQQIRNVREAYRLVYRRGQTLDEAIATLSERVAAQPEVEIFLRSLQSGLRGLTR